MQKKKVAVNKIDLKSNRTWRELHVAETNSKQLQITTYLRL